METEQNKEISQEELTKQSEELGKVSEMRLKALSQLVGIHIDSFSAIMIDTNGVTYKDKLNAAKALKEAVLFALDFGLNATNAEIRQKGTKHAKEVNSLAGILVQALDTRMLLLASKLQEDNNKTSTEKVEQKQGEDNVQTNNEEQT